MDQPALFRDRDLERREARRMKGEAVLLPCYFGDGVPRREIEHIAYPCGLAIRERIKPYGSDLASDWTVTHILTGYRVGAVFPSREKAREFVYLVRGEPWSEVASPGQRGRISQSAVHKAAAEVLEVPVEEIESHY